MRLVLLASFIACYQLNEYTGKCSGRNNNEKLQAFTLTDIQKRIHDKHFLIGLHPSVENLLLDIGWLYRSESLVVGLWKDNYMSESAFPWNSDVLDLDKQDSKLVFFRMIPTDRKCLIKAEVKATAVPTKTEHSLKETMEFLNAQCFYFVDINGHLNKVGKKREALLKNLYRVSKSTKEYSESISCKRIPLPESQKEFVDNFLFRSKPVIIEDGFKHWEALSKWSNEYLRKQYSDKKVHVKLTPDGEFEGCDLAEKFDNFNRFKIPAQIKSQLSFPDLVVVRPAVGNMKFSKFLDLVEGRMDGADGKRGNNMSAYLEYSSIREYFPDLEDDLEELPFMKNLLKLSHLNIWLSNGNTLGKLHFDPFDNILCQIRGQKKFTIFDPQNNYNLYEAHIQEAILSYDKKTDKFRNSELLDSTSMVMSPIDILNPDFVRFPNYTKANPMECVVNEGDAIYLPAFWWHEVQSFPNVNEHRNLAVNFWYEPFFTKEFPCVDCKLDVNPLYRNILAKYA